MELNMYAVYDEKAQAFRSMHFVQSDGVATRNFGDAVCSENPNTAYLRQHPSDFSLYCVGSFDDESGLVQAVVPARLIVRASDFLDNTRASLGGVEHKNLQGDK